MPPPSVEFDIPNLTPAIALELWREAAKLEVGLRFAVRRIDIEKIKPLLYNARKAAGEPALANLMLCVAPGGEELWIVKRSVEAP